MAVAIGLLVLVVSAVPHWLAADDLLSPRDRFDELARARQVALAVAALAAASWTWWFLSARRKSRTVSAVGSSALATLFAGVMIIALKIVPPLLASTPETSPADRADTIADARWSILALFTGSLCAVGGFYGVRTRSTLQDDTVEARIRRLAQSLNEVGQLAAAVQHDLEAQQRAVEHFNQERAQARDQLETEMALLELSKQQAAAGRRAFRGEIAQAGRKQLRTDLALGTLFFVAGAATSYLLK